MFTKEFLDLEKRIPSYNLDKLIEKAINERYGFYYNKYDSNSLEKFKEYLMNHIPSNGFYDIEPLTDKDILESKMDWVDEKEQEFRRYFHFVKQFYPSSNVKFLSKRFMFLYYLLIDKYNDLRFDNATLNKDGYPIIDRINSVYLNDIIYEEGPNHFYKDNLPHFRYNSKILENIPNDFIRDKQSLISFQHHIDKEYCKYKKVRFCCGNIIDLIETLEAERVILERNGIDNAFSLLPGFFKDYFDFCLMYEEQIKYFKTIYDSTNDKTKAVYLMIEKFGIEKVPSKLISYLTSDSFINHKTIEKVKVYK